MQEISAFQNAGAAQARTVPTGVKCATFEAFGAQRGSLPGLPREMGGKTTTDEVVPLLERLLASAEHAGRATSVVAILVQLSLVHHQRGDERRALDALRRALTQAETAGYVRLFIDEGVSMLTLQQHCDRRLTRGTVPACCRTVQSGHQ